MRPPIHAIGWGEPFWAEGKRRKSRSLGAVNSRYGPGTLGAVYSPQNVDFVQPSGSSECFLVGETQERMKLWVEGFLLLCHAEHQEAVRSIGKPRETLAESDSRGRAVWEEKLRGAPGEHWPPPNVSLAARCLEVSWSGNAGKCR